MATQKHTFFNQNASTAPSPPARERIPQSFESRERTRTTSPLSISSSLTSSSSTIVPNGITSTGSDSNLNRMYPSSGSMRQQLLRRLWHKEYRRFDRTGSLSPPLHRSLRSKRAFKILDNSPEVCLECQKLEDTQLNRSVPEITMKRIKHNSLSATKTMSALASVAFARKSYSIETDTLNGNSIISTNSTKSSQRTESDIRKSTTEIDTVNTANILNEINGNLSMNSPGSQTTPTENSFLIEMEGDRINVTTMIGAESTAISENTLRVSSDESSIRHEQNGSINSRSQWYRTNSDGSNNNVNSQSKLNHMDNLNNNGNECMYSHGQSMENESIVRIKTNDTIDQSTIDTIISQILVDSLNNIIVVQGKVNDSLGETNVELSSSQTQTDYNISNASSSSSSLPLPVTDQVYFPHYLSTETLSEYSTKLSNNSSAIELLPTNLVISVISGSSYPFDGGEMVVHRLTDIPRTESMEVQPSSAHSRHDEDENGNHEKLIENKKGISNENDEDDDDAASLVDSLDNPNEINNISDLDMSKIGSEKSQAFFIPIENAEKSEEIISNAVVHSPTGLEAGIANSMPGHLRERLERRQMEINARKEAEQKQRQEKIQKLISRHEDFKNIPIEKKATTPSFEIIPDKSPTESIQKVDNPQSKTISPKKTNNKRLRSEIGLLESYTVDGHGNLQFVEPGTKSNGNKKVTTVTGPVVKHVAIKKTITTKPMAPIKKARDLHPKKIVEKRINITKNRTKVVQKRPHEKMTLVHHSPSDMITPDRDCGPRRMYQKTEICEGTKRIEILEIVECLNSSSDGLNSSPSPPNKSKHSLISAKQSSKIPIPVPVKNKSRTRTIISGNQQRSLRAQIRDSVHGGTTMNNSKVDQIIADLLIEALNHSTDIGIEFIKTPQPNQSIIKLNNSKRINLSTRRTGNTNSANVGSGKRSAHSSAKYQQVFDAIPEEKSSSLSIESPSNDENAGKSEQHTVNENETVSNSSGNGNEVKKHQVKVASGKAAIESDHDKTAETWFGCFGRAHVDSPIDGLLLDEGILKVVHTSSVAV